MRERTVHWGLRIGMLMPVLMVADVWLAQRLYPKFDAGSQFISELGAKPAPYPWVFNLGMLVSGVAALIAGAAFTHALEGARGRRQASGFAGLMIAMTGLGGAFAGLFHWPDPMHRACGIGLAIQAAPAFTAWALWGEPRHRRLAIASLVWAAVMLLMFMLLAGVWNVRRANDVGLWQRAHAVLGLAWLALACWALERRRADSPISSPWTKPSPTPSPAQS